MTALKNFQDNQMGNNSEGSTCVFFKNIEGFFTVSIIKSDNFALIHSKDIYVSQKQVLIEKL